MSESLGEPDLDLKAKIVELLDENRTMTVATVRPDGWPQATMVGYAHDDLTLYFVIARTSQKLANIKHDPRVSIAIGRLSIAIGEAHHDRIIGLSMAASVAEVTDMEEIERVNRLAAKQWPEQAVFAPREVSAAVMRATPTIISVIDLAMGPGQPDLVHVTSETTVHRASGKVENDPGAGSKTSLHRATIPLRSSLSSSSGSAPIDAWPDRSAPSAGKGITKSRGLLIRL